MEEEGPQQEASTKACERRKCGSKQLTSAWMRLRNEDAKDMKFNTCAARKKEKSSDVPASFVNHVCKLYERICNFQKAVRLAYK